MLCYDTASSSFEGGVPSNAPSIMFYEDGLYANKAAARHRFPQLFATGRAIGLTVLGRVPVQGDDYEPGNWRGNAGQWCAESIAAGIYRPIVYMDESDWNNLVKPSLEAVFGRPLAPPGPGRRFRSIIANPDGDPTIPADHDGKQYWWSSIQGHGQGDFDISNLRDDFFLTSTPPIPNPPQPTPGVTVSVAPYMTADHRVGFVHENDAGEIHHIEQQNAPGTVDPSSGHAANTDFWRKDDGTPNWLSLGHPGK